MSPHPRPHTVALTRPSRARLVLNVVKEGVMSITVEHGQGRSSGAATATYIGPPRRIYVTEPLESPVPAKRASPAPKEPADPRPKRKREPKVPAP